jgi:uncharacterized protein (TIRG00374 family)
MPDAPLPAAPPGLSRRAQIIVFLLGLSAFAILVARAGVRELLTNVYDARWVLGPIVAVWGVVYICNTIAWRTLLGAVSVDHEDGHDPHGPAPTIPFARAYAITVASFAINYVTPFVNLGGEPYRIAAAAPYVGTSRSAASVVCFRLVHTMAQIIFWITALPLAYLALPHTPGMIVLLLTIALSFSIVLAILFGLARQKTAQRTLRLLSRVPVVRRLATRLERNRPVLARIDAQLAALWGPERHRFVGALVAEYIGRALSVLEYLFITRAIGLHVSYLIAFVIGALSQFFLNMLFFIPFDVGTKEGGMYLIFDLLRLPARLGVYAAIVMRLRELVWIAVGLSFVWLSHARHD